MGRTEETKRAKGVEPSTNPLDSAGKVTAFDLGGVKAALGELAECPIDPDLTDVANAWPTLPAALRAGIVAMVNASASNGVKP